MRFGSVLLDHARSIPDYDHDNAGTDAANRAATNFEANRIALEEAWPAAAIALPDALPELEYVYARDGALSARHCDGHWFGDMSVPRRAAERMLASLEMSGSSAILLAPPTASHVRVALGKANDRQSLIAVIPGEFAAGVICACDDFSAEIRARRLWLIVGPDWPRELDSLLDTKVGVAPAALMIRVPGLNDERVERMIKPCEKVIGKHNQLHRHRLAILHERPRQVARPARRVCVITGRFKLWQAEPALLAEAAARSSVECVAYDTSRPDQTSTLAFARAADGCDAVLSANVSRTDLPFAVPTTVPWTTLVTIPQVPAIASAGPGDALLVVSDALRQRAIETGWPSDRVRLVHEPSTLTLPPPPSDAVPALMLDYRPAEMPTAIKEMSSHSVVWERVRSTLETDFDAACRQASPTALVAACARAVGVPVEGLPVDLIAATAVLPTYARALAVTLAKAGVTFTVYGHGWDAVPELATRVRGPIVDVVGFTAALRTASGIIDVWPGVAGHASRRTGRPTVSTWGRTPAQVQRDGQAAIRLAAKVPSGSVPLTVDLLAA